MGNRLTAGARPNHERCKQPTVTPLLHDQHGVTLPLKVVGSAPNTHDQPVSHYNKQLNQDWLDLFLPTLRLRTRVKTHFGNLLEGLAVFSIKMQSIDWKPILEMIKSFVWFSRRSKGKVEGQNKSWSKMLHTTICYLHEFVSRNKPKTKHVTKQMRTRARRLIK